MLLHLKYDQNGFIPDFCAANFGQHKMYLLKYTPPPLCLAVLLLFPCVRYGESTIVRKDMSNKNLSSVPYIEAGLHEVDIDNNLIREIGPNGVAPATDLMEISLNNNHIRIIDDNAFVLCTKLERVELKNNELLSLPSNFGTNLLLNLDISLNENLSMPQSYFSRFIQMERLNIGYTSIVINDWKGIETLRYFSIDGASSFPNFNSHPKLKFLYARHLQLNQFPDTYISNLPQLEVLMFDYGMFQSSPVPSNVSSYFFMVTFAENSMMTNIEDMTHLTGEMVWLDAIGCPLHCGPGLCWMILEQHPNIQFRASCATPSEFNGTDPSILSPLNLHCYEGK